MFTTYRNTVELKINKIEAGLVAHTSVISALMRLRQEDRHEFKVNLEYAKSFRPAGLE